MTVLIVVAIACLLVLAGTVYWSLDILRSLVANLRGLLAAAERERDSYADALATVLDQAGRGDVDGVVAHARQALEVGDYHGRLRAAQEALEAAEEEDLLSCSCLYEAGRPA